MKQYVISMLVLSLYAIVHATYAGTYAADRQMESQEIRSAIVGNTLYVTGVNGSTKWEWAAYFRDDGSISARSWWAGGAEKAGGAWKLQGNQYCSQYETKSWGGGELNCYDVIDSDGRIKSVGVSGPDAGKTHIWNILDGNPHGL